MQKKTNSWASNRRGTYAHVHSPHLLFNPLKDCGSLSQLAWPSPLFHLTRILFMLRFYCHKPNIVSILCATSIVLHLIIELSPVWCGCHLRNYFFTMHSYIISISLLPAKYLWKACISLAVAALSFPASMSTCSDWILERGPTPNTLVVLPPQ